jgi:NADH:ubiquinone oxidoreductase subunit 6 (subunit J)
MFFGLSCLIGFIMIFFAIGIILSKNPVYTVLSFILIIVCISIYLIGFLQNEFLGLVLLIVYAGAIAVLFLFVVMMLNIRLIELTKLF